MMRHRHLGNAEGRIASWGRRRPSSATAKLGRAIGGGSRGLAAPCQSNGGRCVISQIYWAMSYGHRTPFWAVSFGLSFGFFVLLTTQAFFS